jgi:hypothetical protein
MNRFTRRLVGAPAKPKPASVPEPRTLPDIQQEYTNLCAKLGDLIFRREVTMAADIDAMKNTLLSLNGEARAADELAKKTAPQPGTEVAGGPDVKA